MSNLGKVWNMKEVYKKISGDNWTTAYVGSTDIGFGMGGANHGGLQ